MGAPRLTWSWTVDRGLRGFYVVATLSNAASAAPALASWSELDAFGQAVMAGHFLLGVVAAIIIVARKESTSAAIAIALAGCGLILLGWAPGLLSYQVLAPVHQVMTISVFIAVSATGRWRWLLVAPVLGAAFGTRVVDASSRMAVEHVISDALASIAMLIVAVWILDGMRRVAGLADAGLRERGRLASRQAELRAVEERQREIDHLVHDRVLYALRSVAAERRVVGISEAKSECAVAVAAMDSDDTRGKDELRGSMQEPVELEHRLRFLADSAPLEVTVTASGNGEDRKSVV